MYVYVEPDRDQPETADEPSKVTLPIEASPKLTPVDDTPDGPAAVAGEVATIVVPTLVRTPPSAIAPNVSVVGPAVSRRPLAWLTVGLGYVPPRSPPAEPVGVRASERRLSLPWHDVPEVVP